MSEHYQSQHAVKEPKKKLIIIILAVLLGLAVIGAGVYALLHFVILAPHEEQQVEETLPAIPESPTLAPKPTEPPTEAPTEPDYAAMADKLMSGMTDKEKICQLFIVDTQGLTGVADANMAGDTTKAALEKYPVGGIIYTDLNLESVKQTTEMISKSQSFSKTPMFIAVDEEGGDVARVASKLKTTALKPMYQYKDKGVMAAYDNAKTIASDISALGFNLDFAPVADIGTACAGIGERSYGDDADSVAQRIAEAVAGFHDGGVLCTLKHFPGHGQATGDTHEGFAEVSLSADELKNSELVPFDIGIKADADMVMIGHLTVSSIDPDNPATLSSKVVPQLLREQLGYDGIAISDAMNMSAIKDAYGSDYDAIVKGLFDADIDIILMPDDLDAYIEAIESALENGTIQQSQIDAKVKKILTLKFKGGIIPSIDTTGTTEAPSEAPSDNASAPTEDASTAPTDPTEETPAA